MSRRDTIDSMTAGETVLLAAMNSALDAPSGANHFAMVALATVKRYVASTICVPAATDMVARTGELGEVFEAFAGRESDEYGQSVFIAAYQAAYEFSQALDHNLSMEAVALPF